MTHAQHLAAMETLTRIQAMVDEISDRHADTEARLTALELRADAEELARPGIVVSCACGTPTRAPIDALATCPATCAACRSAQR